ncbi:hypothetical protein [Caulobacter sp. RHG1]|uniref:hypothetical protein n=1 Tax=Caulobacter sp. (strain RHG1) TaxID=2545762 RepID=UPI001557B46D|nr:hypothetical protein [Caulobacter sp. RHG1]NQE61409.1 hypothetical protein [Caulobacter sp. RHG1]
MSFAPPSWLQLLLAALVLVGAVWFARGFRERMHETFAGRRPVLGRQWIVATQPQPLLLSLHEGPEGVRFQVRAALGKPPRARDITLISLRSDGLGQRFDLVDRGTYLESKALVPKPHAFTVRLWRRPDPQGYDVEIEDIDGQHHLDGTAS